MNLSNLKSYSVKIESELCKRSFYYFFIHFWDVVESERLVDNWHIEYLCNELQNVAERVFDRENKKHDLIINIAPGESKSSIATVFFPVWCWINDPATRTISSSYSASLSIAHAVKSRDLILSDRFRQYYPHIELKRDQSGKSEYKNTSHGERIATSTGGTITGKHGHFIIIDDPLNPKEAASDVELKNANDYIDQTLNSRKVDKAVSVTILIMQRLHENDPTGHLLAKGKNVKHICLPGELSKNVYPTELKKNYKDGLLDPQRLSKAVLDELETDLGSYGYSGQIMQSPSPEGGGIWQKWFNPIPDKEFDELLKDASGYGTDWDLAYTEKQSNSASAYGSSFKINQNIYIDKLGYAFKEFPELIQFMKELPAPHYIEGKASGKSAKQTLTKEGINAIEVDVTGGDKIARARMATPTAEAGRVYIRESLLDFLYFDSKQGLLKFPNASHDDVADVISQLIQRHSKSKKLQIFSV